MANPKRTMKAAAARLGISRSTLYVWRKESGLDRERFLAIVYEPRPQAPSPPAVSFVRTAWRRAWAPLGS